MNWITKRTKELFKIAEVIEAEDNYCQYCDWPESAWYGCHVRSDGDTGYICSRHAGHDGPHVACGIAGNHELFIWDEPTEVKK